jgi:hypothetical protein
MKTNWTKEIPSEEGWYWIKYRNKYNMTVCPCSVVRFNSAVVVTTARNTTFIQYLQSKQLRYNGKIDKTVRFGPKIPIPK